MSKQASRSDTTQRVQICQDSVSAAVDSMRPEADRLEKNASSAAMAAVRLSRTARRIRSAQNLVALKDGEMPPEEKK